MKKGWSLLGVQSILGGLIVLAALLLYFVGGEAWGQLKTAFQRVMTDDALATAIVQAWNGDA